MFRAPSRPAHGPCVDRCPRGHRGLLGPGRARESFSKIVLASASEFPYSTSSHGGVAQLGERLTGSQEVRGSIPLVSTRVELDEPLFIWGSSFFCRHKVVVPIIKAEIDLNLIAVNLDESNERVDDVIWIRICIQGIEPVNVIVNR